MSRIGRAGSYLYEVLSSMIQNNVDYFKYIDTEIGNRILAELNTMQEILQWIETTAFKTLASVQLFDFDADTPANGYRSFLTVVDRFILLATKLCRTLCIKRDSVFFRAESCLRELTDYVNILRGLKTGMTVLVKMLECSQNGDLFVGHHINLSDLFEECDAIDPTVFYGRCVGFYFCDSIRRTLRRGHAVMTAFRDQYYHSGGTLSHTTTSLISFGKYIMDSNLRAKQVVEMRRNVQVDFLKAMWSLNEMYIFKRVNRFVYTALPICNDIVVPLELQSLPRQQEPSCRVDIPYPGPQGSVPPPLHCRLLSLVMRDGQQSLLPAQVTNSCTPMPPSQELVLHCHGGGFISQSAESHEIYLRDWAKLLNVPILSIDYSLSPESPFPRALEEVLYTYAWALNNCHKLGWTGERICVAGDSAGGNLALALCLKTIELGVRRPDAVFCAYTPIMLNACPSPSKVLTCIDPLIPLEFLLTCVHAYMGFDTLSDKRDGEVPAIQPAKEFSQDERASLKESKSGVNGYSTLQTTQAPLSATVSKSVFLDEPSTTQTFESSATGSDMGLELVNPTAVLQHTSETENLPPLRKTSKSSSLEVEGAEENVIFEAPPNSWLSFRHRPSTITTKRSTDNVSTMLANNNTVIEKSASKERVHKKGLPWFHPQNANRMKIMEAIAEKAANPLITPYLAPDETLRHMPPAYFLCLHLDPTLDDMIMLAKKLRSLGCTISVKVLDFLPHGFLNLFPRGNEAQDGIQCCADMIRESLKLKSPVGK